MELVNGLPKSIKLGKRLAEIDMDEKPILRDNGGMTVATLRQDRTFSDSFNKALESRYNLHAELVGALEDMEQRWELVAPLFNGKEFNTVRADTSKSICRDLLKRARGEA